MPQPFSEAVEEFPTIPAVPYLILFIEQGVIQYRFPFKRKRLSDKVGWNMIYMYIYICTYLFKFKF